jgi:hypothetical protein
MYTINLDKERAAAVIGEAVAETLVAAEVVLVE